MAANPALTHLLLVGGKNRSDASLRPEWEGSEKAVIAVLDLESGELGRVLDYESPSELLPVTKTVSHTFKSSSIYGSELLLSTTTSVLVCELPELKINRTISLPAFNDVHHVIRRGNGNIAVANTGLDQIVEMGLDGEVLRYLPTNDDDPWERFDTSVDYRKIASTKPHAGHPNFVSEIGGELWATRFKQCDMINVEDPDGGSSAIKVPGEAPHDGLLVDGSIYLTSVDGIVTVVDRHTLDVTVTTLIRRERNEVLGWCRGVHPWVGRDAFVGFSRIRRTKFKANVKWVSESVRRMSPRKHHPTRVAVVDTLSGAVRSEVNTEVVGLDTIFSILPLDTDLGAEMLKNAPVKATTEPLSGTVD